MKMTITWLGGPGEPESNEWNGVTFKAGEPVEIDDEYMLKKASKNAFYEVKGHEPADDKKAAVADRMAKARAARKAKAEEDTEKVDA